MAAFDSIIFLSRDKIDFHFGGKTLTFPLLPTFAKDIEIIDKEVFRTQLTAFLDKNGITFGSCAILLSDSVCFISESIPKKQNPELALTSFIGTLPFENPVARILGDKLIGTNKDLYMAIVEIVGQSGGRVKMISPSFLSKEMMGKKGLDDEMIRFVLGNEDAFIKATFNYEAPLPVKITLPEQPKKKNKREVVLIGVFVALLLGFIIWGLTALL